MSYFKTFTYSREEKRILELVENWQTQAYWNRHFKIFQKNAFKFST